MQTSAAEPLISVRPFAVTKWSAWLVSKVSPRLLGSLPSYTKLLRFLPHPLPSSPYRQRTKNNTWVTKTLGSQDCGETKHTAGMSAHGQVRSATCGQ